MWPMQMGMPQGGMMMPGMMPGMPPMPQHMALNVRVEGIKFDYQLTEDDVRTVFSRYGGVVRVNVDADGTAATVTFDQPFQAIAAQQDLDHKQLAGMAGASLRVDFATKPPYDPAALAMLSGGFPAAPPMFPPTAMPAGYPMPALGAPMTPGGQKSGGGCGGCGGGAANQKKNTCKIEVGIENESDFRVGSRVIQVARQIWEQFGGKTRLRGKGCGGPHEADEPLALCISNPETNAFNQSVAFAEQALAKIHTEYKTYCEQNGKPVPNLQVRVNKKVSGFDAPLERGEKPADAPNEEEIERLIEDRNEYRKATNYKKADEVRDYLKQLGVVLMDDKGAKGRFQGNEITKWRYWRP